MPHGMQNPKGSMAEFRSAGGYYQLLSKLLSCGAHSRYCIHLRTPSYSLHSSHHSAATGFKQLPLC